jgi:transcriptional regulator with XRE-family HTH domain
MLSEASGMSNATISRILNGKVEPHKSTIQKIMKCYPELNPNWVLTGNGEMIQDPTTKIDWKEEAFTAIKEENTFLKKQLELLNNVVNTLLSKHPNFHDCSLQVGKIIPIYQEGVCEENLTLANAS